VDYVIPANDDAIRAVNLITSVIADAVIEGKQIYSERTGEPLTVGSAALVGVSSQGEEHQHFLSEGMQEEDYEGGFEELVDDYGTYEDENVEEEEG